MRNLRLIEFTCFGEPIEMKSNYSNVALGGYVIHVIPWLHLRVNPVLQHQAAKHSWWVFTGVLAADWPPLAVSL